MTRELNMCIVNADLIDEIRPLVGSQAEIMRRVGISWNSWIKVASGLPIRRTLGERLRMRVLGSADALPGLRKRFPSPRSGEAMDFDAFQEAFFKPMKVPARSSGETTISAPDPLHKPAALETSAHRQ